MNRKIIFGVLLAANFFCAGEKTFAQGTAFNYQGRLNVSGNLASGAYDFRFQLYDALTNGNTASLPQTNLAVNVAGGLFNVTLDFGSVFTGTNYWLSIGVRTNGDSGAFTLLVPRQPLLPVPYAIFATSASNLLGALPASQLSGTLPSAQISGNYSGSVNFTNSANSFSGTFFGNGMALTNLNGSQITSGTVADARLTTNVALLNRDQTFSGANNFTNNGNSFMGSFFGNGLVGWIVVSNNTVQAMRDAGYLLLSTNVTTVTLPPTNQLFAGDIVRISGAGSGGWRVAQNNSESVSGNFLNVSNASWLPANVSSQGWRAIASSADGVKMVASAVGGGGIYISTDFGKTWNSSSLYAPSCLASSADGVKLFGGVFPGGIVASTNSGSSWYSTSAPTTNWNSIACSADGTRVVAVVNPGRIYTSTDSGNTWTRQSNPPFATWYSVASSSDGKNLVAADYGGKIYTSVNFGVNWTAQSGSDTTNWTAVASSADGTKLAAAAFGNSTGAVIGGRIYTSTDSGVTWTKQTSAPSANWYGLASSFDGARLVAVANKTGGIYVSGDYGITWTKQSVDNQDWYAVACSQDLSAIAAVSSDTVTSGKIYFWQPPIQGTSTSPGTGGYISSGVHSAVELQYIGGGNFVPVSSIGTFWAN